MGPLLRLMLMLVEAIGPYNLFKVKVIIFIKVNNIIIYVINILLRK